jgi:signal transduction histidine kinase
MEPRTPRVHLGLLGLGLVLYLWGFAGQSTLARLPDEAAERLTAFPVQFGGVEASSYGEVRFLAEGYPPGARVELRDPAGRTEAVTLPGAHSVLYLLVTLVSGILFLWISGVLFGPRADNPALRDLMIGTWTYGLAVMIGGVYFPKTPWGPDVIRGIMQLTLLAFLPVIFLHLACVFPRKISGFHRFEWAFSILAILALVLVVWQETAFLDYFREPGPSTFQRLGPPLAAADLVLVAEVLLGLVILGARALTESNPRERSLLRALLSGFAVGLTPYVFLRTLPGLLGWNVWLPPALDRVSEMAIPLVVVFVVVRYRFLDIDVVVRRRLLYTAVAFAVVTAAIIAVMFPGAGLDPALRSWHFLPVLGLGLVAGVFFLPLRDWIGHTVDRRLFHIRHDATEVLARFDHRLDEAGDQAGLARTTREFLQEVVALERVGIVLRSGDDAVAEGLEGGRAADDALALVAKRRNGEPVAAPGSTDTSRIEDPAYPASLIEAGFPVAAPLETAPDAEGAILLGPKRTGRRLVAPDLRIVTDAAAAARLALARMRLVQEAERAQIKDRFFSRVAHDLRTPLTAIGWSVRNLRDGVIGDLTEQQREYLDGMRTSTEYLGRLVENLLEMGRLERGQVRVSFADTDLRAPVEQAAETVRPIAGARTVRIEVEAPAPVPVRTDAGKVVEILVNLLENAVRYSPDGGTVRIRLSADPPGFSVSDEGPGLGGADPERLFARFEQGPGSPYAPEHGFGLGLHIVSSYVRLLGGEVTAADGPGGGACFTVRLPGIAEEP